MRDVTGDLTPAQERCLDIIFGWVVDAVVAGDFDRADRMLDALFDYLESPDEATGGPR
jgi:hypothetical protein